MKKTAVDWLIEILNITNVKLSHHKLIIEQAKQMEKEQIIDAYETSHISMMTAKQYYNETFNKKA
jgi:hypothetical protein